MADASTTNSMQRLSAPAESLADQVAGSIRQAVYAGTLQPGRLYSAYQMAETLGVSRSPVREALISLAEAGLVEFERNRGFRIILPAARDIAELFHLRLLLEVPATRRVAAHPTDKLVTELREKVAEMDHAAAGHDEALFMRHDQQLHAAILNAAGNSRLVAVVDSLRDKTRLLGASTVDRSRTLHDVCGEHLPIVDAIAAGDPATAGRAMSRHITHTGKLLVAQALAETSADSSAEVLWSDVVG